MPNPTFRSITAALFLATSIGMVAPVAAPSHAWAQKKVDDEDANLKKKKGKGEEKSAGKKNAEKKGKAEEKAEETAGEKVREKAVKKAGKAESEADRKAADSEPKPEKAAETPKAERAPKKADQAKGKANSEKKAAESAPKTEKKKVAKSPAKSEQKAEKKPKRSDKAEEARKTGAERSQKKGDNRSDQAKKKIPAPAESPSTAQTPRPRSDDAPVTTEAKPVKPSVSDRAEKATKAAPVERAKEAAPDRKTAEDAKKRKKSARNRKVREPEKNAAQIREQVEKPATVSVEAAKPKAVAAEPIEAQIKEAEKRQTAVVPKRLTSTERDKLRQAERRRRERARENREELLGAAAVGAIVGALIPQLGGMVAADAGDRLVVVDDGNYFVHHDDSTLFRDRGSEIYYERLPNGLVREVVVRPDGTQIISVKDDAGALYRREKITPDGRRIVFFDARYDGQRRPFHRDYVVPDYTVNIPYDQYIVSARAADRSLYRATFAAAPVYQPPQRYSLATIRQDEDVRALVRRVDLDTITFETGSAYVSEDQVALLGDIAGGMLDVIENEPDSVFLVEGHTDAIGSEVDNMILSDRRAETVARILVDAYGIAPENLVMQGYGEAYLKIDTEEAERANRRVAIRNITPLLAASQ